MLNMGADRITISGVTEESIVDGPGIRYTLFLQGCPHHCPGCHNPGTHDMHGGYEKTIKDVFSEILENSLLDGITFSGGEPFEQAEALTVLAGKAIEKGLNIVTYTGYSWDELYDHFDSHPAWKELCAQSDILIDGRFVIEEKSLNLAYRGSVNQRLLDGRKSVERGMTVEWHGDDSFL